MRDEHTRVLNRAAQKRYRLAHPDVVSMRKLAWQKKWRRKWGTYQNGRLLRYYGMTLQEWEERFIAQDGKCAVCHKPLDRSRPKDIHVDHNHVTGIVRGLLCASCNRGLGFFKEDPDILAAALDYLRSH